MRTVYTYDKDRKATGSKIVNNEYQLAAGETLLEPDRSLYPPYVLSADGSAWSGTSKEDYLRQHPIPQVQPTFEQQMIMKQQARLAQLTEQSKQLQQLAMKQQMQIAQLQKDNK